jgi:large subunit ribosomal protein L4
MDKKIQGIDVRPFTVQEVDGSADREISPKLFAQSLRVLHQNWRQGTVACKGRSDVARSNRKPWKQKGTGRARAGSARSPLWKGGGVIHGPQPRVAMLKINRNMRKGVFAALWSQFAAKNRILVADWDLTGDVPQTSQVRIMLQSIGVWGGKVVLFTPTADHKLIKSCINIPTIRCMYFDHPDAFHLSHVKHWIVLKKDIDAFKEMVNKWL